MSSLLTSVTFLSLLAIMVVLGFWPKTGLFWKWQRGLRSTERVLLEDALKHLYDQEYKNFTCTLHSVSGTLAISGDQAARLMARLEAMGLIKSHGEQFELTSEGRSYALRMIRIHRLWERYLADETGVAETEWHRQAEIVEHNITDEEAEALSAAIGNPRYDPHGDPIPTASGSLPPKKGRPLTDLKHGELAYIIHIEDEPEAVYAQLVAEGLHPGMQVRMLEKSSKRVSLVAEGEEIVLAPVVAANITVEPLPRDHAMEGPHESLAELKIGETCEVIGISKACRGLQRRRLMDLGIVPGTMIKAEMRSAGGDPTAYNIRDANIALRNKQAELIHIRRLKETVRNG